MSFKIEIKNFKKRYRSNTVSFESLLITKRVTLIIGENGSGKSTLLKALAGFIRYKGTITGTYKYSYSSETVSYPEDITLYQFYNTMNYIREEPVNYELLYHDLVSFSLEDKIDEPIKSLSKGMKQKVGLLQCLRQKADIYLLDEPLSGVDAESIKKIVKRIKTSKKQFIIATHLQSELLEIADEVITLG